MSRTPTVPTGENTSFMTFAISRLPLLARQNTRLRAFFGVEAERQKDLQKEKPSEVFSGLKKTTTKKHCSPFFLFLKRYKRRNAGFKIFQPRGPTITVDKSAAALKAEVLIWIRPWSRRDGGFTQAEPRCWCFVRGSCQIRLVTPDKGETRLLFFFFLF